MEKLFTKLRETVRRRNNAKKAKAATARFFPEEKWIKWDDDIYVSSRRKTGKKTNFIDELRDAQILRDLGSTVYLVPEDNRKSGKKYDAIVDGLEFEFKNVSGNANTLTAHFLKSRSQAPNVFINLEKSNLTKRDVLSALYGARKSKTRVDEKGNIIKGYTESNRFSDGLIILKIKGQKGLIYLDVDKIKIS